MFLDVFGFPALPSMSCLVLCLAIGDWRLVWGHVCVCVSRKLFQGPLTWQVPIEYSLNTCGPVLLMWRGSQPQLMWGQRRAAPQECKQTNLGFKFVGMAWNLNFKTQNPNPQNPRSRIQTSKIQTPKSKLQKQKIKVQNPLQNQKIQIPNSKIKKN